MFECILVPLDGSRTAEMVLPYASEITLKCGSRIVLARVSELDVPIHECQSYLENTAKRMKSQFNNFQSGHQVRVEKRVLQGNPANEILNCANDIKCDLIVIASRGASPQKEWPLGNVAGKILHASACPVLLIRKQVDNFASTARKPIKKIMVTLDGSELSETVLPLVEELSRIMGAEIVLFRAIEPYAAVRRPGLAMTRGMAIEYANKVFESTNKPLILEYMKSIKEPLEKRGLLVSVEIRAGSAARQIIEYAAANSVDLITMSTHGLSGLGRWVFGSVTEKVLHAGDTPVLVVRPMIRRL